MWLWSKLSSIKWQDAWEDRLYGNQNSVINEIKGGKSIRVEVYCETKAEADAIAEEFGGSVREVKNQNWVAMSVVKRAPIKIRDKLVLTVEPPGEGLDQVKEDFPGRHVVSVPADMAFGTGDHETTATCLRMLIDIVKERKGSEWTCLDMGCGTGVLGISAKMLGAKSVYGFDFDEKAVIVAKRNVEGNGVENTKMEIGDVFSWKPKKKWDVIFANMFATILQRSFPAIVSSMAKDADLMVSGILFDQWEPTKEIGEKSGLIFNDVRRKGKWVTARASLK